MTDLYINPDWRWYHDENHQLANVDVDIFICPSCGPVFRGSRFDNVWFGLPKPALVPAWFVGLRLNERFHHVRDHAWLDALGDTLPMAEVELNMERHLGQLGAQPVGQVKRVYPDGWPLLFAFHAWSAAWMALKNADESSIYMDAWEAAHIGDRCRGRACGETIAKQYRDDS